MIINKLKTISDEKGNLIPLEFEGLPFIPKRIFYVIGVPKDTERGRHAHYNTEQLLICIKGKIRVKVHNGYKWDELDMEEGETVFIDKMIWDSQVFLTGEDILLVLSSTNYDSKDYIDDWVEFLRISGN